ncbi:MAG: DUF4162 domain-containing protein, partial [Candidatus Kerfeldbacteria bacterium]|nr:DUF4162 domain-containing protein [Candidatus Kerfeldbacteria bacterium]
IMDHAKIIAFGTPLELLRLADAGATIEFHIDRPLDQQQLQSLAGVNQAKIENHVVFLKSTEPAKTLPALFALASASGVTINNLQMHQATLEDVFLKLTGHTLRD